MNWTSVFDSYDDPEAQSHREESKCIVSTAVSLKYWQKKHNSNYKI